MALRSYLVGEVTEDFASGLLSRREALHRLGLLGMTVGAATALLAACGGGGSGDGGGGSGAAGPTSGTAAAPTSGAAGSGGTGSPSGGQPVRFAGPRGELQGAWAAAPDQRGAVLVIHENRGLTAHFFDLVGRFARDRYSALCVDLLSAQGGTASLSDPAAAPAALANTPVEQLVGDLRAGIDELQRRVPGAKIGTVGFCFGGGMVWNLLQAGEQRLAAAVPFYGPAPDNPDFRRAKAAVYAIYAERDTRVNASRDPAEAALRAAGLTYEIRTFPGADHAFFNDTGPRYNEQAAREAYRAVLDWFGRHLS
ncbi:MAG TPA: dienelactone hydrolase family protein [Pseudonocardiaceae bacterium]|jgi:carboxymethylenebutenolidase